MPQAIGNFSATNPGVSDLYTFDFDTQLVAGDSIPANAQPTWTITAVVGTDAGAQSHAIGSATIFGTKITQRCANFSAGVRYMMSCQVLTQFGNTPLLWAFLECEAIGC